MKLWENGYRLTFESNSFMYHEEIVLSEGSCDGLIPMSFVHHGEETEAFYECSGYAVLSSVRKDSAMECLETVEKVIDALEKTVDFMVDPERMKLVPETVFESKEKDILKIAFVPERKRSLCERIAGFIEEMKKCSCKDSQPFLEKLLYEVSTSNLNTKDAFAYCRKLKKRAFELGFE